jgi:hypothetical protein
MPITDFNLLVSSSISADSGNLLSITSAASDVNTTNSVAAMTFKNTVAHTAGDLEFQFRRSDDVSLLKITDSYTSIAGQLYLPDSNMAMTGSGIYSPAYRGLSSNYAATLISDMADGASAIGTIASTSAVWSNATAKLLSIRNGNIERSYVDKEGLFNGGVNAIGGVSASALATPVNGTHTTAATGGTLVPGTYYYRVSATNALGQTLASTETSKVVPAGTNTNTVTVVWGVVMGATGYKVYGRTTGAELLMATVTSGNTLLWLDDGSVAPAGALPTANSTGGVAITGVASGQNAILIPTNSRLCFGDAGTYLVSLGAGEIRTSAATNFICLSNVTTDLVTDYNGSGLTLKGNAADGASAIGVVLKTNVTYSNATSKLVSISNGAAEKAYITKDGDFVGASDIGTKLVGQPLWRSTLTAAAATPVDNTNTPGTTYTLTAGQVVMLQSDVLTYVEIVASASMTASGAKAITLQANQMYHYLVKSGALKVSVDCPSGSCNVKLFTLEV